MALETIQPDAAVVLTSFTEFVGTTAVVLYMWFAYTVVWHGALRNRLRQRIFNLRDEMFLDAADGRLSFDDPAYGMIRQMMNHVQRNAEEITFASALVGVVFWRAVSSRRRHLAGPTFLDLVTKAIEDEPSPEKAKLYRQYFNGVNLEVGRYVLCWTPVIGIVCCLVIVLAPAKVLMEALRSAGSRRIAHRLTSELSEDTAGWDCASLAA